VVDGGEECGERFAIQCAAAVLGCCSGRGAHDRVARRVVHGDTQVKVAAVRRRALDFGNRGAE
jgi:hypothetical protein